ncbi:kinase-like domain-containing protein [Fusarium solani]|uniref:Kinase-like domain-containing protein n=1 Tax=Fusarium solani TaxID=169388 RepID=A0A9P9G6B3_FUSSL|nr:kinase-like domain-containing protein [Fusarium solani]KAH7232119.1 kinase-like domain-containing protein [Fusarium solani]
MIAVLRPPFPSLSADNSISSGGAGHVYATGQHLALKSPIVLDNPHPTQTAMMEESQAQIACEKAVYKILMENRHPHIVHAVLCAPEGIFMHRQATTLKTRLKNPGIPQGLKNRWIKQLSSALSWLEHLGFAHGDLRPANIFLGPEEDIRLGDFDCTVKIGEKLKAGGGSYGKLYENYQFPDAGPMTEQYSLGSCIFTIQFGHEPWHEIDEPQKILKLIRNEFPDASGDEVFGEIIQKCWHGKYDSIREVEQDILSRLGLEEAQNDCSGIDEEFSSMLVAECEAFLEDESRKS